MKHGLGVLAQDLAHDKPFLIAKERINDKVNQSGV